MDHSLLAILLLGIGLCLLVAEVFIPSGGLILVMAISALAASVWSAWLAWWDAYPAYWWTYFASLLVLLPATVGTAFYLLARTSVGKRVILRGPRLEDVTPPDRTPEVADKIGRTGLTVSLLNPGGTVEIDGERFDARSLGMLIYPEQRVRVVGTQKKCLMVMPWDGREDDEPTVRRVIAETPLAAFEPPEMPAAGNAPLPLHESAWIVEPQPPGEPPLDFEIPDR